MRCASKRIDPTYLKCINALPERKNLLLLFGEGYLLRDVLELVGHARSTGHYPGGEVTGRSQHEDQWSGGVAQPEPDS